MWQCFNCGEQHEEQFEQCWKCGSNRAGQRTPYFEISEPVTQMDQAPATDRDDALPEIELPTITYFSIPPFLWINWVGLASVPCSVPLDLAPRFSSAGFLLEIVFGVLVGIPVFVAIVRATWVPFFRRQKPDYFEGLNRFFATFRLPASLAKSYRWFVPVYYGSLIAIVPMFFALVLWRFLRCG
jgi:hypothetical protein